MSPARSSFRNLGRSFARTLEVGPDFSILINFDIFFFFWFVGQWDRVRLCWTTATVCNVRYLCLLTACLILLNHLDQKMNKRCTKSI